MKIVKCMDTQFLIKVTNLIELLTNELAIVGHFQGYLRVSSSEAKVQYFFTKAVSILLPSVSGSIGQAISIFTFDVSRNEHRRVCVGWDVEPFVK